MKTTFIFLIFLFIITGAYCQDTFSICAVDTVTGEMGSAGASCIDENAIAGGCIILSDVIPGVGVIHSQAYWNPSNQNLAHQLMIQGLSPQEIIDSLVLDDVQNNPHIRQYGVVDLFNGSPRCAAYTGINCDDYKNHIIGPNYTIQGNILLGQQILDSMEVRFLATEGELACKLMAALQGAKIIGADTRCIDDGVSSLSAFLRVGQTNDPPDDLYLDLNVPSTPFGIDPIDVLQEMVDEWGGCIASGVNANQNNASIHIYPNPSNGLVKIEINGAISENITITIFNSFGEVLITRSEKKENLVALELNLSPGLYFYKAAGKFMTYGGGKLLIH